MAEIRLSPHIHCMRQTKNIMRDVLLALLPAAAVGVALFGLRALILLTVSVATSMGAEWLYCKFVKKESTLWDMSAAVTGLLLGLSLPADVPLWQVTFGNLFAIWLCKSVFGGLGRNVVNPAIAARVFMLLCFDALAQPAFPEGISGATPLSGGQSPGLLSLFAGLQGGSIGETSALALLVGGVFLALRRVISVSIPISILGSVFVGSWLLYGDGEWALVATLSGGLLLAAIFMATDPVTSPITLRGKILYGILVGGLTVAIRAADKYPEGVSFALLFGNILCGQIDRITAPRLLGRNKE